MFIIGSIAVLKERRALDNFCALATPPKSAIWVTVIESLAIVLARKRSAGHWQRVVGLPASQRPFAEQLQIGTQAKEESHLYKKSTGTTSAMRGGVPNLKGKAAIRGRGLWKTLYSCGLLYMRGCLAHRKIYLGVRRMQSHFSSSLKISPVGRSAERARPAFYFFFRYSSIALRISALTASPVFSDFAFSFFWWSTRSQMFVRISLMR